MNREQFMVMSKAIKENPARLREFRKKYRNVYPFSDGIFKILLANKKKPQRTVMFLNAMLGLTGKDSVKTFKLEVQEIPGVLSQKTVIFDVFGTTQNGDPVLIEVQQSSNDLFEDRLLYYTSRIISNSKKKGEDYNLPHVYVLSLMIEDQFPEQEDDWFHTTNLVRDGKFKYKKLDIYNVEVEKFFAIDKRTAARKRDVSPRARMLRIFRDVLEDKAISPKNLQGLLDTDFAKDVSFQCIKWRILTNYGKSPPNPYIIWLSCCFISFHWVSLKIKKCVKFSRFSYLQRPLLRPPGIKKRPGRFPVGVYNRVAFFPVSSSHRFTMTSQYFGSSSME